MANVNDVAAAILQRQGAMSTWKLQKLVYYCQAWHLVWEEEPLFNDEIQAWANGPVVPALYATHRGTFTIESWPQGKAERLAPNEAGTVEAVLKTYGHRPGYWLSELTHRERPWVEARQGLANGERGNRPITHEAMADYYSSLL